MENGLFCCFEDKMLSLCFLLVFLFFDHSKVGRDYEEEHRVHILILHSYLFILITEALPGQRSYSFSNGISYWFLRACICMCALSCLLSGHVPFFSPRVCTLVLSSGQPIGIPDIAETCQPVNQSRHPAALASFDYQPPSHLLHNFLPELEGSTIGHPGRSEVSLYLLHKASKPHPN